MYLLSRRREVLKSSRALYARVPPVGYSKNRLTGELEHIEWLSQRLGLRTGHGSVYNCQLTGINAGQLNRKCRYSTPEYFDQELEKDTGALLAAPLVWYLGVHKWQAYLPTWLIF